MALLRTNVRSEASDGISMTVKEPNELSVAQDGIDRAPDLHAAMAAHRDPQEQLQDDEQAGGRASERGAAAAARQRRTPRQRDGGQQRAVLRPPERPIGRAAITSSDLSGDIALQRALLLHILLRRMKTRAAGARWSFRIGILFGKLSCHVVTTRAMFRAQYCGFTCSSLASGLCLATRKWEGEKTDDAGGVSGPGPGNSDLLQTHANIRAADHARGGLRRARGMGRSRGTTWPARYLVPGVAGTQVRPNNGSFAVGGLNNFQGGVW